MAAHEDTFLSDYTKFLDSSGNHLTYAAISLYRNFNEGLSEKERRFLKNHLDSCQSCAGKLEEVDEVENDVPKQARTNVYWLSTALFRYSIAAVVVLAVGVSVLYYRNRTGEDRSGQSMLKNQSLAVETTDPERFAPNPTLESVVGRTVRSQSEVKLLAPVNGDSVAIPFTFRWEGGKEGEKTALVIVDNKNIEMWKDATTTTSLTLEKNLKPGLYYAKLEVDGILAAVGKFIVPYRTR